MNILILGTGNPSQHLISALKDRGHTYHYHDPEDLYVYVSESANGYDRIYNGHHELKEPVRLKVKEYDTIISRLGSGLDFGATILQHLNENLGIYSPQTADGLLCARDKMKTAMRLSFAGVKVPLTVFAKNPVHVDSIMNLLGGLPVVGKLLKGSQGVGVMIFRDAEQTNTSLQSFWKLNVDVLLQRYIESGSKDIRAIVVGDKVVLAVERTGSKDFRANISQGGTGKRVELTKEQETQCVNAAKALGLEFAGVDLMKDENDTSYIVEVNGNPGTKVIDITGHNYFVDLIKHVENQVGKKANSKTAIPDSTAIPADTGEDEMKRLGIPSNQIFAFKQLGVKPPSDYIRLLRKAKQSKLSPDETAQLIWLKSNCLNG
jgi:ribosomal protein S6--L-glutamate ligase